MTGGSAGPPPPPPPPPSAPPLPPTKRSGPVLSAPPDGEEEDLVASVAFRAARSTWYHRLILHLNHAPPLIQEGPTCGLAAVAMALAQLGCCDVTVASLLEEARRTGMSAQGEMFSAADLARLAGGRLTGRGAASVRCDLGDGEAVARAVLRGDAVLVPYDADRNNEPCVRGGAAAHWALVCGALIGTAADADDPREADGRPLSADELVFPVPPQLVTPAAAREAGLRPDPGELLLVCRQSKSRRLAVWRHDGLAESNGQLRAARPLRDGEEPYILSQGSVEAGLCGLWVQLATEPAADHPLADWLLHVDAAPQQTDDA